MAFGDILNWVPFSKMKAEDAKEILKDKGYPFANLWNEIRPLQKPQIDLSLIIPVYNNEKYRKLFTAEEINTCKERLTALDYFKKRNER